MIEPAFTDKLKPPGEADLGDMLGKSAAAWRSVVAHALGSFPGAESGWKHYGVKHGWQWVLRAGRKNVVYLKPGKGAFTAMLALSEQGVKAAAASDLPEDLVAAITRAPKYAEGRAARIDVKTAKQAAVVKRVVDIRRAGERPPAATSSVATGKRDV